MRFNLQAIQLLLVVKKVTASVCIMASPFGASGCKWSFEFINVPLLELKIE